MEKTIHKPMSQDDLNAWISNGFEEDIVFGYVSVRITDENCEAHKIAEKFKDWLLNDGQPFGEVIAVEDDENFELGCSVDISVMPSIHPKEFSFLYYEAFGAEEWSRSLVAWSEDMGQSITFNEKRRVV